MLEKSFYQYIKMSKLHPIELFSNETKTICMYLLIVIVVTLFIYLNKYMNKIIKIPSKCLVLLAVIYLIFHTNKNISYAVENSIIDDTNLKLYYVLMILLFIFLANVFYTLID